MSTTTASRPHTAEQPAAHPMLHDASQALPLAGRILFSLIFLLAAPMHFTAQDVAYGASNGVPLASLAVPLSGVIALAGALSILLGYKTKIGAWLIVLFLVPVTLYMHRFWAQTDPMMAQMQMANFMKNVAMTGGALLLAYFGAGPLSLDARLAKRHAHPRD